MLLAPSCVEVSSGPWGGGVFREGKEYEGGGSEVEDIELNGEGGGLARPPGVDVRWYSPGAGCRAYGAVDNEERYVEEGPTMELNGGRQDSGLRSYWGLGEKREGWRWP